MAGTRDDGHPDILTLTDGANRFLHAMRDLGYMDGRLEAEILDRAMNGPGGPVGFEQIRRLTAQVAFEQSALNPGGPWLEFLDDEWKLVFH